MVYKTTPIGRRKQAAAVGIPVSAVTTAEPPGISVRWIGQISNWYAAEEETYP